MAGGAVAIIGARVVPVVGEPIEGGTGLVQNGKITAIGAAGEGPDGVTVIGGGGSWVLPGFIDAHAHVGVHEEGEGWAGNDTNEMTDPVMAQVRAIDAIYPADIGFRDAITGGGPAGNVNPGSGKPTGGGAPALHTFRR